MGNPTNENHVSKVTEMLNPENYVPWSKPMPTTGEIVATLVKGSSDHKHRPPLKKATANNLVG